MQTMLKKPVAIFTPLDWQKAPWRDKSAVLLLTGSAGGGKSRLAAEKLHAYCKKYPGATAVALRKIRASMTNSTVLFMARKIVENDPRVRHYPSKRRFEYDNGSILAYGGMKNEEQREQIRSIGQDGAVDIAWMEEANRFTEDDFNEVIARMRGKAAGWMQIILSTNPDSDRHWIYRKLIQAREAHVYYSDAEDNIYNPPEYIQMLGKLTGVLGERLREGRWTRAEGIVYSNFSQSLHVIEKAPECERYIASVDWGYTNPGVIQIWGVDGDNRMYCVCEIYQSQRTIDWWIQQARALKKRYQVEAFVCDPAEPGFIEQFKRVGLNAVKANNNVLLGIQTVMDRFAVAGDGRPRLFFVADALEGIDLVLEEKKLPLCTEQEISTYIWQRDREDKLQKEKPVDKDNHGLDCMRYAALYLQAASPAVEKVFIPRSAQRGYRGLRG